MRNLLILAGLTTLCLTGCGNTNDDVIIQQSVTNSTTGFLQPSPTPAGVQINSTTALAATTTIVNTVLTNGGAPELALTPATLFSFLDARHPNAVAESVQASFGALALAGSSSFNGSGGGSVTSTVVNGTSVTLSFNNYSTANGTLSGQVVMSGAASAAGFTSNSTFTGLQVYPLNGRAYRLDGPAGYNVTRTSASSAVTSFNSNQVITDLSNGGTASLQNYLTVSTLSLTGSDLTGSQRSSGRILFREFQTLTGFIDTTTQVPASFRNRIVSAGQATYTGIGATRLTVVSADTAEIAFSNAGANLFTPVQVTSLSQLVGF